LWAFWQNGSLLSCNVLICRCDDARERAAFISPTPYWWHPPVTEEAQKGNCACFAIPEYQAEKDAADEIKAEKRIIVILGIHYKRYLRG